MVRHVVTFFIIAAFLNLTAGCTNTRIETVPKGELTKQSIVITSITLVNGRTFNFDKRGARFKPATADRGDAVAGTTLEGTIVVTPLDSVLSASVEREEVNVAGTVVLAVLVVGAIAGIVVAATADSKSGSTGGGHSCPYVYSFDGTRYSLDAEPLGGAITAGLQRTDLSRLEQIAPSAGEYRLLVRNESPETQFIDEMKLVIVDHARGVSVSPDDEGHLYSYATSTPPLTVVDEQGRDLRRFFDPGDNIRWQTQMPNDTSFRSRDVRHHLTFAFAKPRNARSMKFLVNAGTAEWGSNMIREMLLMRGNKVDDWYRSVDARGAEYQNLVWFMEREELFTLNVNVKEGSTWARRGLIRAGGPLVDEDRIVDVDVSRVAGDTVILRLDPPRGYWKFDTFNAVDTANPVTNITELSAASGRDESGADITPLIRTADNNYYAMPDVGNRSEIRFPVPGRPEGTDRSVYLKTTGYYRLHLPKEGPEQTSLLFDFGMNPGKIVSYSLERYWEWRQGVMESLR